jgi:hypothetical protein
LNGTQIIQDEEVDLDADGSSENRYYVNNNKVSAVCTKRKRVYPVDLTTLGRRAVSKVGDG